MPMTLRVFVDRLSQVKASVKAGEATPEVEKGLHALTEGLRAAYTPEQLKASLAADTEVPTALEESMTTLFMLWMQHRGHL